MALPPPQLTPLLNDSNVSVSLTDRTYEYVSLTIINGGGFFAPEVERVYCDGVYWIKNNYVAC